MFSPIKSTPKMRTAMTPRVRSSCNLQEAYINKPQQFSTKKSMVINNQINPQKVNEHLNKKLGIMNNFQDNNKINVDMVQTQASVGVKQNNYFNRVDNNNVNNNFDEKEKGQKVVGREIQWNANDKKNYEKNLKNQENSRNSQNLKKTRCMSAQNLNSNHSQQNDVKSSKIKSTKKQFQQKFNVAFNYLIGSNYEYLGQRLSMCHQKARPKQKILQMERVRGISTYRDHYTKKKGEKGDRYHLNIEPQNQKTALFISPSKIYKESKTQQIHNDKVKQGKKADLATWDEGFKLQGPVYNVTTNQSAYPAHGNFQRMVPIATFNEHPLGMPHKQTSTNRAFFKGEQAPKADLATWNNLNPYGNDFSPRRGTQYQNVHCGDGKSGQNFGNGQLTQQWPHPQHKLTNLQSRQFNTQVKDNFKDFTDNWLNYQNRCKCGRKKH